MSVLFKVSTLADPTAADDEITVAREGWAAMRVRPNFKENGQVLWADLLEALGHESAYSSFRGRAGTHSEALAYAWLAVDPVGDLVVAGANMLPPRSLTELCTLTSSLGVRTWLLYDVEVADEREDAERRLGLREVALAEFLGRRRATPTVSADPSAAPFPVVPDTQFLGFLDISRHVLRPGDFELVSERYADGRDQMRERLRGEPSPDDTAVARHLHEICASTNDVNELCALVKGAQTGAFLEGWYLRVDLIRWAQRGAVAGLSMHLDDGDWTTLGRMHRPTEAALSVLSALGFSVDTITQLRATDVAPDGLSIRRGGKDVSVPTPARRLLVAQHVHRLLVQSGSDRFLVSGPKDPEVNDRWAGRTLRVITRDTGVVLRGWNASRRSIEATGWTGRLGVSITRLSA